MARSPTARRWLRFCARNCAACSLEQCLDVFDQRRPLYEALVSDNSNGFRSRGVPDEPNDLDWRTHGRANRTHREHRIAGAAAVDGAQRKAGSFEKPLVTAKTERPLGAPRDEYLTAVQIASDTPHDVAQVARRFAGFESDFLL